MDDIVKKMAVNGLLVWEEAGEFVLQKMGTSVNPAETICYDGKESYRMFFKTYQDALAVAMRVLGEVGLCEFSVHARFDRGLGWETKKLPGVRASRVAEAKQLAWDQTVKYFAEHEDLKEARLAEVRIRPGNLE